MGECGPPDFSTELSLFLDPLRCEPPLLGLNLSCQAFPTGWFEGAPQAHVFECVVTREKNCLKGLEGLGGAALLELVWPYCRRCPW